MELVVDTNVPVVANGRSEQASPECVSKCAVRLSQLMCKGKLVLDDGRRILKEYMANLKSVGQPGPGDVFLKWVLTNYSNRERCDLVQITPRDSSEGDFEEFPLNIALADFDKTDRKFVAVALAHSARPPILQAVDTEWWKVRESLADAGVTVDFLCEKDIRAILRKKGEPRRADSN
jgi:hypothetical protein